MDSQKFSSQKRSKVLIVFPCNHQLGLGSGVLRPTFCETDKRSLMDRKSMVDDQPGPHFGHALGGAIIDGVRVIAFVLDKKKLNFELELLVRTYLSEWLVSLEPLHHRYG